MNLFHSPFLPLDSFAHLLIWFYCFGLFWVVFGCLHVFYALVVLCVFVFCCVVSIVSICLFAAGWLLALFFLLFLPWLIVICIESPWVDLGRLECLHSQSSPQCR